jgi:hypothetical protein
MSEQVEWRVMWEDEHGTWHNAQDGAQTLFGLTRAKELAQKLGAPWQVRHRASLLSPDEHEAAVKTAGQAQIYGSQWAP